MPCPRHAGAFSSGCRSPPPEQSLAVTPAPGQRTGTAHRVRARWRPGPGQCSAPGPSARIFVAQPLRSIAPSSSPAAGKGHWRTSGGGAAGGTLARAVRRPSHPCAFTLGQDAHPLPALFLFCVSLISTASLLQRPHSYFSPACRFVPVPPRSFSSLSLFLSLSLCVGLSPQPPGSPTPSSVPADSSWVHTCPQRSGLTKSPLSGCMWGYRKDPPHCHLNGPGLGGVVFPWPRWGGGCRCPRHQDNSRRRRWINGFSARRG